MKTIKLLLNLIVCLFFLQSCASNSNWAKRIQWEELELANLPDQERYPDAGAVVLYDVGKMETFGSGETGFSEFRKHKIIKIFNVRGRRYANVVIPYSTGSSIENIQARTISADGKISVLNKRAIYDVNLYPNFIFYSDQRAKIFTFPSVDDGSVLEYKYNVLIGSHTLWHGWSFQSSIPTRFSRFTLVKPKDWNLDYRVYGVELLPDSTVLPGSVKSTYVWEITDMNALKSEFGMPPAREIAAQIAIAPVWTKSWDDVAKWYYDLASPQMKIGGEAKQFVVELTKNAGSDEEKLKLISSWIRDRVRYIAVAIGIGGFRPHSADNIFLNQYGDCKDMTTLMCTMAREIGIPAFPVIVSTWQNGIPDTSLATPFQFNHMIGYFPTIGDSGIWIDATDKGCPFGQIPWYSQGLPVLVVGDKGKAKVVTTPLTLPESNKSRFEWTVSLKSSGAATVKGISRYWGAQGGDLRESFIYSSKNAQKNWLEIWLAKRCSGAELESFEISGLHPIKDPLEITYTFKTKTFAIPRKNQMVFKPNSIYSLQLPDYFRSADRTHPIRFAYGYLNELDLTIKLPTDWFVENSEPPDSVKSPFGSAFQVWSADRSELKVKSNYLLKGDDIPAGNYQKFKDFLDQIRKIDLHEIVLSKKSEQDY